MTEAANIIYNLPATEPRETRRALPMALLRAREAVLSHFRPMFIKHGVTEQQWRVMRVLAESGMLDASELAERAFILAPSLTRMIRSLEERGFISRHKDRDDGRRVLLKIAPAGMDIIHQVMPDGLKVYAALEGKFGKERMEHLLDMLDEIVSFKADNGLRTGDE